VGVSLRSFRPEDAAAVLELSRRAQTREKEQVGTPLWSTREELDAELSGLASAPEETLRVAEDDDGAVAGFGGIELEDETLLFGPIVAPAFRGRKVGRTLLAASIELARAKCIGRLVASVGVRNLGGRLMLERNGFEPRGGPVAVYRLIPESHHPVDQPAHPGVTTRIAEPEDVDAVLALCHECLARSALSDEVWARAVDRGQVRLAEEDGQPVAVVRINPSRRRVFHGVTEGARARGLGGFVLSQSLQEYWHEHPSDELRLTVPVENVPASRIYRHQGFLPWLVLQPFELVL
jgi:ribosomal protein S18 acetylase RimI-like enzyme